MNTSLIRVSSYSRNRNSQLVLLAYSKSVLLFLLEVVSLWEKRVCRKWCFEDEWRRLPRSSQILQLTVHHSWSVASYSLKFDVLPPRCSSRVETLSFYPQVAMACLHTLCQFRLDVGHVFCQFIFCWALKAFLSLSDCADDPTMVSSYIGSKLVHHFEFWSKQSI